LKLGIYFDLRDPPPWRRGWDAVYARALETAEHADARGIGSIWLSEHHFFEDGYLPQPLVFAAALGARTKRARIGTAVLIAPLRSAVEIAEEAAVADAVSGGRIELGLGTGYRLPEFEAFGAAPEERFEVLEHRGREVGELLAAGRVTPRPIQDPLPIWIGGHKTRAAGIAGRLGAGLLSLNPDAWDLYCDALEQAGHDRGFARAAGPLALFVADDPERAWAAIRPHAEYGWRTYDDYAREGRDGARCAPTLPGVFDTIERGAKPPVRVVTVAQAARELRQLAATATIEHVFFWERVPGMPDDLADRHVELILNGLIPAIADLDQPLAAAKPPTERTSR